jgi:hypothetical protein
VRLIRPGLAALLVLYAALALAGGCRGDDDDAQPESSRPAPTGGVAVTRTAASGAGGTPSARTPGSAATPVPSVVASGGNATASSEGPSSFESTFAAEAGEDVVGGDPSDPRELVGDVPTPPPGASIDSGEVALPDETDDGVQIVVDMDAALPGVQSSRTLSIGDVFRVAIVVTNVPSDGVSAFNFFLDYDRTKIVAPSYTGGSSTDRNPDLHNATLGDGWACLPAPEGDLDDPGGIEGDGDPATGRALLSCFNPEGATSGTVVVSTVEFYAVAGGESSLTLSGVAMGGGPGIIEFGRCEGDITLGPVIPCVTGSVTVQ